ncbi:MAG: hypothetical protein J6C84_00150 [Lachnospiraceae bacterium]|nr:hypothetical protein [Lachnospiraceae bacterium]
MKSFHRTVIENTIKIAGAAAIAILTALCLDIEFAVSAGIVAILTIQPTKKETIRTAVGRLMAFGIALLIAWLAFGVLGYTMTAFFLYLAVFILICQIFRWYSAMAMNSVLISHFLTFGNMGWEAVSNEVFLFVIGVGIGILANLHLHKNVDYIEELKTQTDQQIKRILSRMSERILDQDVADYNGECFVELWDSIRKAGNVAEENYNNQFGSADVYDREYIRMRDRQCQVLYEMYKNVRTIETTPITATRISEFLKEMSEAYHKDNTGEELLQHFFEMDQEMKTRPLPTERKEFEDRAMLFGLLRNIEEFLKLKMEFSQKYAKEKSLY